MKFRYTFLLCLTASFLLHVLLVHLLSGYAFLAPSEKNASGQAIQVRLLTVTVPAEKEPLEVDEPLDVPAEEKKTVLQFQNPNEAPRLEVAVTPADPSPAPRPVPVRPVQTEPASQDAGPQPVEVTSAPSSLEASYWDTVRAAVAREIRYPSGPRLRKRNDRITLQIVVDASGQLIEAGAVPPRGDAALTRAALQAVQRAAPFEAPAQHGLSGDRLTAELPIRYQVRRRAP